MRLLIAVVAFRFDQLEPKGNLSLHGGSSGNVSKYICTYSAFVMLAIPCLLSELIGGLLGMALLGLALPPEYISPADAVGRHARDLRPDRRARAV